MKINRFDVFASGPEEERVVLRRCVFVWKNTRGWILVAKSLRNDNEEHVKYDTSRYVYIYVKKIFFERRVVHLRSFVNH